MANKIEGQPGHLTWGTQAEFAKASAEANKALYSEDGKPTFFHRSVGSIANRYQNIDGTTSVRDSFNRVDYEYFRPGEQLPKRIRDIIFACNGAYQKIAMVRQIIDLMGDFCAGGIKLFHPNETIERFYTEWFKHVNGPERSERLANGLYRVGQDVVKRNVAKLDESTVTEWKRTVANTDVEFIPPVETNPMEIPVRYTLLNPLMLEVLGEEVAAFTGNIRLALKMPTNSYKSLNLPLTSYDPAILTSGLPQDIQKALDRRDPYLLLDPEKIIRIYYKKDDWDVWAYPLLYSILDDLMLFQKMKLADLTALDGVISHIRIWKLGSLKHKILPTDAAVNKLAGVLLNHLAGGGIDLIWGPDLELEETSTDVYKFLGGEKYQAVVSHIQAGLGIPSSLTGDSGGFSQNFLSLRTLIERLEYGRQRLIEFWDAEIKIVQKAMGFRYPAQVTFTNVNLHDENSEKALWIQLADRGIISIKSLQEKFGQIPEIEQIRINREMKSGAPKLGPYTDGQPDLSMKKIFAQRGVITPSQAGVELDESKEGEENAIEMQGRLQIEAIKEKPTPTGVPGQGRPGGSKDSKPRKQRTEQPRSSGSVEDPNGWELAGTNTDAQKFMELVLYANKLQKHICDIVNPFYLNKFNKQNMRQLTATEEKELETFKFWLLFNCDQSGATEENVLKTLSQPIEVYDYIAESYNNLIAIFTDKKGLDPTQEELKYMRNYLYSSFKGNYE